MRAGAHLDLQHALHALLGDDFLSRCLQFPGVQSFLALFALRWEPPEADLPVVPGPSANACPTADAARSRRPTTAPASVALSNSPAGHRLGQSTARPRRNPRRPTLRLAPLRRGD